MRPPRTWSVVLTLMGLAVVLEDSSRQVSPHPFVICGGLPLVLVLVIDYVTCLLRAPGAPTAPRLRRWRWLVLPCAALVAVADFDRRWAMKARFSLSRPAFERALAELRSGKPWPGTQWVGLYPVSHVDMHSAGGEVCFVVGDSIADPVAICYAPGRTDRPLCRRILGDWFAIEL